MNNSEIKIYKAEDGKTEIQVKLDHDTVSGKRSWQKLQLLQILQQFKLNEIGRLTEILKQ
jgi:hypothetical protein